VRRTFLKNNQFTETKCCVLGEDFIGNGHWLINRKYASNRKKFETTEQAKEFIKDISEILEKDETLELLIERKTKTSPLIKCEISDVCLGPAVLISVGDEVASVQAPYANLLKQILGKGDEIKANDNILVAFDKDGIPGLVICLYSMGDLTNAIRNRSIIKKLASAMNF
tara:strand:- start:174948 stop:175454 length:507 start_codon:yes stop_codon:yes gene_type:complete